MSSGQFKTGPSSRLGQGSLPQAASNPQTLLLEKVQARTSTPDSEALASSDDENDQRQEHSYIVAPPPKPVRRSSWLNDTSQPISRPRKGSFASSSMSPTGSNPSTPSAEPGANAWGSHQGSSVLGRPHNQPTFPWGTGIWNSDRKDPPSRLSEVLPSPTSVVPPGAAGNSFFGAESGLQTSPASRDQGPNSQIPFAIPLHPTPKTYRSQSYSVGQLDPETPTSAGMTSSAALGRARHPGLQHRPSRPSMLSEMSNDGTMLGEVKEVEDDDDESATESLQGSFHQSSEAKTIEMLARENAILRQQQQQQQQQQQIQQQQQQQYNARIRPRASTSGGFLSNGYGLHESVPEESDYAVDELEEANEAAESLARRAANRRMSEYGAGPYRGLETRKTDSANLKKALWSTSLGFPVGDASQSRRHSFANMPTRQGSISSIADSVSALEASVIADGQPGQHDYNSAFAENAGMQGGNGVYFQGGAALQPNFNSMYPNPYMMQQQYPNRAPSPHRNAYSVAQPRHNQLLHMVLFKCARADVFYIQEGTGLNVKPGDLVIVEADRGTDLGTVAKENVDWHSAKEMKEHYAEEQYKWLMMYSQNAAAAQDGAGAGLLASANSLQGSAVGGMGPPSQHHMQEPSAGELRPKLIKRLAQQHEVHALRDKEGQEAKAKRVCMQKVKEHGLNMEILDAEFQMDWKKLTFYYFADSYINFNSLVTDLFKIYKTRIWMSAINPASFASPTLGIQAPSGVGPGAVGVGRGNGGGNAGVGVDRHQNQQPQEAQGPAFPPGVQAGRGYRPTYNQPYGPDRSVPQPSGYPPTNYGYGQANAFGTARGNPAYVAGVPPGMDGFANASYPQQLDFQSRLQRYPGAQALPSPTPRNQGISPISPQGDWTAAFQGLSLNSH